MENQRIWP